MDLDHSWNALLRPGAATEYFDVDDPERVRIDTPGFDSTNAWWFAELSRWIYRQEFDDVGASANRPRRPGILEAANLKELRFFNRGGTRCAIVESKNHGGELFGVLAFRGTSTFGDWLSNLKTLFLSVGQGLDLHSPSRSSTGWSPASASRYGRWPPPPGCRRRRPVARCNVPAILALFHRNIVTLNLVEEESDSGADDVVSVWGSTCAMTSAIQFRVSCSQWLRSMLSEKSLSATDSMVVVGYVSLSGSMYCAGNSTMSSVSSRSGRSDAGGTYTFLLLSSSHVRTLVMVAAVSAFMFTITSPSDTSAKNANWEAVCGDAPAVMD